MTEEREDYVTSSQGDDTGDVGFSIKLAEARAGKEAYDTLSFIHSTLDDARLDDADLKVYVHLLRRAGKDRTAYPSHGSIGHHCWPDMQPDASRRKAIKSINGLVSRNMIERKKRDSAKGGYLTNLYLITLPSEWKPYPLPPSVVEHPSVPQDTTLVSPDAHKGTPLEGTPINNGAAFAPQKTSRVLVAKKPAATPKKARKTGKKKPDQLGFGQLGVDNIDVDAIGEKTSEFQDMKAMVYEILGWNPQLVNQGYHIQVSRLVKQLRDQRYTVDSLRDFWNHVWSKDFRWVKDAKHPTLNQLRAEIGKLHTPVIAPAPPKQVYGLAQDEDGRYVAREAVDGQLPAGIPQLTPDEVVYYSTPRAKRRGEN